MKEAERYKAADEMLHKEVKYQIINVTRNETDDLTAQPQLGWRVLRTDVFTN